MQLLEREPHLAALDSWLREAASEQGRLVLIGGEAGAGKTSLVDAFAQTITGRARILRGACDALSTPRPLGPLLDIAIEVGGELDRMLSSESGPNQVFRATLAEFSSGLLPTVVIIEDAHWADEATLDLLRFLGRRLATTRILLIVTYRDDEVSQSHPLRLVLGDLATAKPLRRLNLAPLSSVAIRTLVAGSNVDPDSLFQLTRGNPFFLSEVLANNAASGIPAAVSDAVIARASRLETVGREVLDAAAVIGSPINCDLLLEVSGESPWAVGTCIASGMLVQLGQHSLSFRHELARVAIYEDISPLRRRELHGRVLSALQACPVDRQDLARLAHHAEASGDGQAVLRLAPRAARQAAELSAHREAAAQYARALRFADDMGPKERAELMEACAYEYYLTNQLPEAIELCHEVVQIWRSSGEPLRVSNTLRWLSRYSWFAGRNDDAVRAADEAIAVLETLPPGRQLAMALSNRAQLHMLANELDTAIALGERAIADSLGETEVLIHALANVGCVRMMFGNDQGRVELERSVTLARAAEQEEHVARGLVNLAVCAIHIHDLPRAEAYLRDGIAVTTDHNLDNLRPYLLAVRGLLHLLRGNWIEAASHASVVLSLPDVAPITRIEALKVLGRVRARRGDPGVAELLDEALALAESTGEIQRLQPLRVARAEAAWLAGDRSTTIAELQSILDLTLQRGSPWDIGGVFLWLERYETGLTNEWADQFAGLPAQYRYALAGDWASAAAAWNELGCPYESALAMLDGDEEAVRRARAIFEELEARPAATIAARRLRSLGVRGIPRGPRPATRANPANLTARELEILSLLAAGRRNAEIAEHLFLSPKTVDHHVGRVLAKLNIRSRAAAAGAARRCGIMLTLDQDTMSEPPK